MSKDTQANDQATLERLALKELERAQMREDDPHNPEHFNFIAGKPMPKGFQNPPPGEPGHFCTDPPSMGRNYQPTWSTIRISRMFDHQANPQAFPTSGRTWHVALDVWTDVPPEVIESLNSAEETVHSSNLRAQETVLGKDVKHETSTRPRFFWHQKSGVVV